MNPFSKIAFSIFITFFSIKIIAQKNIGVTKLEKNKIPAEIKYSGTVKDAVSWTDKLGKNIVITTETGKYENKKSEISGMNAEIYAYHFVVKENISIQTWKVSDFIKDCELDIQANFIKNTFQVTDLNGDGIGEIWLMYKTTCVSDVSPAEMKIIMYESMQKFAMRGQNKVKVSETEFVGGDYKFDKAFFDGPKEFREFAKKMWEKNILQTWD